MVPDLEGCPAYRRLNKTETVEPNRLLALAQRLQALAQAGITYHTNAYDLERYEEIRTISAELLEELTDEPFEKIMRVFASETGYATPKVDVRAVVFQGSERVLMVREKLDRGRWTLPGGWADIGFSPFEVAAKEALEETGLIVKPVRLLALWDMRKHSHPPQPWHIYKAFVHCRAEDGALLQETPETAGAAWFAQDELGSLDLSTERVTLSQLNTLFQFARNPDAPTLCE